MVAGIENYIQGTFAESKYIPRYSFASQVETPNTPCSELSDFSTPTLRAPIDYGFGVLYDATTDKLIFAHTKGVPVPSPKSQDGHATDLVALAMCKGFVDSNEEHGGQTVGKVIKALVEPTPGMANTDDAEPYKIDANWHADVTGGGLDRYSLLYEAAADLHERAYAEGMFDILDDPALKGEGHGEECEEQPEEEPEEEDVDEDGEEQDQLLD